MTDKIAHKRICSFWDAIRPSILFGFVCGFSIFIYQLTYGTPFSDMGLIFGTAGPALYVSLILGWITPEKWPSFNILSWAFAPALVWFILAFLVRIIARKAWIAAIIMLAMFSLFWVLNLSLLLRYL
jgi:hypothetical protein